MNTYYLALTSLWRLIKNLKINLEKKMIILHINFILKRELESQLVSYFVIV